MTKLNIVIIMTIVVLVIGATTGANAVPIADHKTFEKCFRQYTLSYLRNTLNLPARQYSENKSVSGIDKTANNRVDPLFNVYNCVHGLFVHTSIDPNANRIIK
jgi:hypothetical protein